MNFIHHPASGRGHFDHGWLKTYHSFSFADYFDRSKMNFGALRVLNDDTIMGGYGFGMHPHDNMEIFTLPLSGAVAHRDSMGNSGLISYGEVQVMSAGTGILHSEHNAHSTETLELLQIWVYPRAKNLNPRYDQLPIDWSKAKNNLSQILSPNEHDDGVWINQDAWFNIGFFDQGQAFNYTPNMPGNGIYVFMIEGEAMIESKVLNRRDGLGIWDFEQVKFETKTNSTILVMEVPMMLNHRQ